MLTISTKNFGEREVDESEIITFDEGLPGFGDLKRFTILYDDEDAEEGKAPVFAWLQSVEDGDLCFVLADAAAVLPWYKPEVDEGELEGLDLNDPEGALLYNIARIPENAEDATVNLLAPIVVNVNARKGRQVVVSNGEYGVRHRLFTSDGGGN